MQEPQTEPSKHVRITSEEFGQLHKEWLRRREVSVENMNVLNCGCQVTNPLTGELECLNDTKALVASILKDLNVLYDH